MKGYTWHGSAPLLLSGGQLWDCLRIDVSVTFSALLNLKGAVKRHVPIASWYTSIMLLISISISAWKWGVVEILVVLSKECSREGYATCGAEQQLRRGKV